MNSFGFTLEDIVQDVEIWPENWPVVMLFCKLDTQWNVGFAGATGLRYEAVYPLLDRSCDSDDDWWQWLDDLTLMERAALKAMRGEDG